jgi:hypothetical protein
MYEERNAEIYRERKAGKTYVQIAAHYRLSTDRLKQICDQEAFRETVPELAAQCLGVNFAPAAWLWARGFTIIPPAKLNPQSLYASQAHIG